MAMDKVDDVRVMELHRWMKENAPEYPRRVLETWFHRYLLDKGEENVEHT